MPLFLFAHTMEVVGSAVHLMLVVMFDCSVHMHISPTAHNAPIFRSLCIKCRTRATRTFGETTQETSVWQQLTARQVTAMAVVGLGLGRWAGVGGEGTLVEVALIVEERMAHQAGVRVGVQVGVQVGMMVGMMITTVVAIMVRSIMERGRMKKKMRMWGRREEGGAMMAATIQGELEARAKRT